MKLKKNISALPNVKYVEKFHGSPENMTSLLSALTWLHTAHTYISLAVKYRKLETGGKQSQCNFTGNAGMFTGNPMNCIIYSDITGCIC